VYVTTNVKRDDSIKLPQIKCVNTHFGPVTQPVIQNLI